MCYETIQSGQVTHYKTPLKLELAVMTNLHKMHWFLYVRAYYLDAPLSIEIDISLNMISNDKKSVLNKQIFWIYICVLFDHLAFGIQIPTILSFRKEIDSQAFRFEKNLTDFFTLVDWLVSKTEKMSPTKFLSINW